MAYFDGIKVGDKVWSFDYGWGIVKAVSKNDFYVKFEVSQDLLYTSKRYCFNGVECDYNNMKNQTLFWNEIKYDMPPKPKIFLNVQKYQIHLNDVYCGSELIDTKIKQQGEDEFYGIANHGLMRSDPDIAYSAYKQIKRFARLLALRDQECPNSRGYEFVENSTNYVILYVVEEKKYETDMLYKEDEQCCVYFKTREDAQKICDILNSNRFEL